MLINFLIFVFALFPSAGKSAQLEMTEVSLLTVNSAITPATYDYLHANFNSLPETSLIVLKLNTPGGLVSTTKDIITMIGAKKRPFVVWITPEGASASSAGAIIASAAHFIFMSPATNMGAATPVGLGEDLKESDGRSKALKDLTALVRSLSTSRGRPAEPFEKMINSAESYTAKEAQELKIIDGIISDPREMIQGLMTKSIKIGGSVTRLVLKTPEFKIYEPTAGQKILEVIANPSTAYVLFLMGIALIYFELQAPGGFIAGSIGICFLILSGIAFQVLPLDWGAFGLILAGVMLLIMEIYIVSYGLLSLAGFTALIMGSLFLFHGEGGFISIKYHVMFSSLAGIGLGAGLIAWYLIRDHRRQGKADHFFLPVGSAGHIITKISATEYQIKVKGEIWRGTSEEELALNETVIVTDANTKELSIKIKKVR